MSEGFILIRIRNTVLMMKNPKHSKYSFMMKNPKIIFKTKIKKDFSQILGYILEKYTHLFFANAGIMRDERY